MENEWKKYDIVYGVVSESTRGFAWCWLVDTGEEHIFQSRVYFNCTFMWTAINQKQTLITCYRCAAEKYSKYILRHRPLFVYSNCQLLNKSYSLNLIYFNPSIQLIKQRIHIKVRRVLERVNPVDFCFLSVRWKVHFYWQLFFQ